MFANLRVCLNKILITYKWKTGGLESGRHHVEQIIKDNISTGRKQ